MTTRISRIAALTVAASVFFAGCGDGFDKRPSGLKVKVTKAGQGERAAMKGDQVSVHYTGWLWVNGKKGDQFDSSRDRGNPITFTLGTGRVIKGWDEGIEGMKPGEQRLLIIPPDLAYGPRGRPKIPADSTLFFETELVSVKSAEEAQKEREEQRRKAEEERAKLMAENKKPITVADPGKWTIEASGLHWQITKPGKGAVAEPGKTVSVHYTGKLWDDGKATETFDSSVGRGQPFDFQLGAGMVIKGWDEGVKGMKVGEKRTLIIPADMAYGERAMGPVIKAFSNLYFEVELLAVK